jgi:hypothetical protein
MDVIRQEQEQQQGQGPEHRYEIRKFRIYPITEGVDTPKTKITYTQYFNHFLDFIKIHDLQVLLDFSIVCKMSDIVNNTESDRRDVLQAKCVKMQAYGMKIDLLSNATVIKQFSLLIGIEVLCLIMTE